MRPELSFSCKFQISDCSETVCRTRPHFVSPTIVIQRVSENHCSTWKIASAQHKFRKFQCMQSFHNEEAEGILCFSFFFFSNSGLHALPIENSQLNFSCTGSAQFWVETLQLTQFCIHDPCPSQSQPKLMFFDHALQASSQHPHQSCGCTGCAFWLNSAHCFLVFAVTQVFAHPIGVCVPLETMWPVENVPEFSKPIFSQWEMCGLCVLQMIRLRAEKHLWFNWVGDQGLSIQSCPPSWVVQLLFSQGWQKCVRWLKICLAQWGMQLHPALEDSTNRGFRRNTFGSAEFEASVAQTTRTAGWCHCFLSRDGGNMWDESKPVWTQWGIQSFHTSEHSTNRSFCEESFPNHVIHESLKSDKKNL